MNQNSNTYFSYQKRGRLLILVCLMYCAKTSSGANINSMVPKRMAIDTSLKRSLLVKRLDSLNAEIEYKTSLEVTPKFTYGSGHPPTQQQLDKLDSLRARVNSYRQVKSNRRLRYGNSHPPVKEN